MSSITPSIADIIDQILLGGLLGILGQGVRMIVGLKKLHTANTQKALDDEAPDNFNSGRLLLSLFIGFTAGAIGILIKGTQDLSKNIGDYIVGIMAAGYSGTDFIEGVFNTYHTKFNSKDGAAASAINKTTDNQDLKNPLIVPDESK
jgi:hypothetical protein